MKKIAQMKNQGGAADDGESAEDKQRQEKMRIVRERAAAMQESSVPQGNSSSNGNSNASGKAKLKKSKYNGSAADADDEQLKEQVSRSRSLSLSLKIKSKFKGLSVCLSVYLSVYFSKLLVPYFVISLFLREWCIRQLWCSSIVRLSYSMISLASHISTQHTDIYPFLSFKHLYLI